MNKFRNAFFLLTVSLVGTLAGAALAAPPGTPTSVTATPGLSKAVLSWTPAASGGTPTGYQYQQKTTGAYSGWLSAGTASPFTVTSLVNGRSYTFRVRAVNGDGESSASSEASATPLPPTPSLTLKPSSDSGASNSDGITNAIPVFTVTDLEIPASLYGNIRLTGRIGTTTQSLSRSYSSSDSEKDVSFNVAINGTWTVTAAQTSGTQTWSNESAGANVTFDDVKPTITSAAYNVSSRKLTLNFSEKMDASSIDPSKMHLRLHGATSGGQSLAGASSSTTDGTRVTVTLTAAQAENILQYKTLRLDTDAQSNSVCTTPGSGETRGPICDIAGNSLKSTGNASNNIRVAVTAPAAPATPTLLRISDTGENRSDGITRGTLDGQRIVPFRLYFGVSGFIDYALVTLTATKGASKITMEGSAVSPNNDFNLLLSDGTWLVTATQTTAGATSVTSGALRVNVDDTNPTLSAVAYDTEANKLHLTFNEKMNASTLDLSKITVRDTDGAPPAFTLVGATKSSKDSTVLTVTLTTAQANKIESMASPQLRLSAHVADDIAGNTVQITLTFVSVKKGAPVTLSVSPNPVNEGASASVTASISGTTTAATTVTVSASAADSGDFTLNGTTLTIAAGTNPTSSGTVTIAANSDTDTDNETVTVSATVANATDSVIAPPDVTLTITDKPGAPASLAAVPGDTQVSLSWAAPTTGGTPTGYQYLQTSGSSNSGWLNTSGTGTSHVVSSLTNGTEYSFQVRAKNAVGNSAASDTVKATPSAPTSAPSAPTGLAAVAGDAQASLTWLAPIGQPITSWDYSQDDGTNWTAVPSSNQSTRTHVVSGLTNGTTYKFRVRARNSQGAGARSNQAMATPGNPAPAAPTNLTAVSGDGQVSLSWNAPTGRTITSWDYSQNDGSDWIAVPQSNQATRAYVVPNLTNGTTYNFRVRARNSSGGGAQSNLARATPSDATTAPESPTGFSAVAGDRQVQLSWTAPSGPITRWDFSPNGGGYWAPVPGSNDATRTYVVPNLQNGITYSFRVRAVNSAGEGAPSIAINATPLGADQVPEAPTSLSAEPGDRQITLIWQAPTGKATGWQYSQDDGTWTDLPDAGPQSRRLIVTGLVNGTEYSFRIRAVNSAGQSAPSNSAAATPRAPVQAPDPPSNLTAEPGDGQVKLTWQAPSGSVTGWQYSQSDRVWTDIPQSGAETRMHVVTGLINGTEYVFRVRAVNSAGQSENSNWATATPRKAVQVPDPPSNLTAEPGNSQIKLTWRATTDSATGWQYLQNDGAWVDIPQSGMSTRNHVVKGLVNGTEYGFRVRAVNSAGQSEPSNRAAATPQAPVQVPDPPSNLTAEPGNSQIKLTWQAASDSVSSWQYSQDGGMWTEIPRSGAETRTHVVTGLANGTEYSFRVRAVNGAGQSGPSNLVSATPKAPIRPPDAPTNLNAAAGDKLVKLTWTNPSNSSITGYQYRTGDGPWSDIPGGGPATTSYTVDGLVNGTLYRFRLRAINAGGEGAASPEVTATPTGYPSASVNGILLPQAARIVSRQTSNAIADRVEQAMTRQDSRSVSIGGQSTLTEFLSAHGPTLTDDTRAEDLLNGTNFALPMKMAEVRLSPSLWGAASTVRSTGKNRGLDWNGRLFSGQLGVDIRPTGNFLSGIALSWNDLDMDYRLGSPGGTGGYTLRLTSMHPYVGWSSERGEAVLWLTAGYGEGDLTMTGAGRKAARNDVSLYSMELGGSHALIETDDLPGSGTFLLRVKGDVQQARMEMNGGNGLRSVAANIRQLRLAMEASYRYRLGGTTTLEPSAELGLRHEADDAETGTGVEVGTGIRIGSGNLLLEGKARGFFLGEDHREWSMDGRLGMDPDRNGRGLSMSLSTGYSSARLPAQDLWTQSLDSFPGDAADADMKVRSGARLGYGFGLPPSRGVLTPFGEFSFHGAVRNLQLGTLWAFGPASSLLLTAERSEGNGKVDHTLRFGFRTEM